MEQEQIAEYTKHAKFEDFHYIQANYKKLEDHEIRVDIFVPKKPFVGPRPIVVQYHGGGLICGDSLYPDWWPWWVSDLAALHSAVIVSPNYRLMPESKVSEIFQDIDDFWTWLFSPALKKLLVEHSTPTEIDLSRIFVNGSSAGGLMAVADAMKRPDQIRACGAMYPWVDPEDVEPRDTLPFGMDVPEALALSVIKAAERALPLTSVVAPERKGFMISATQHCKMGHLYSRGKEGWTQEQREYFLPLVALENPNGIRVPIGGLVMSGGTTDTIVPLAQVKKFIDRAKQVKGGERIVFDQTEQEHLFDMDLRLGDPQLESWEKALKPALEAWLN